MPAKGITKADLMHALNILSPVSNISSRTPGIGHLFGKGAMTRAMPRKGAMPRAGFSPFQHDMASRQHYGGLMGFGSGGLLIGGKKRAPAKKAPRKTIGHARNQARGAIVRQVMMQHGLSLPQASHYIKMHNIAY